MIPVQSFSYLTFARNPDEEIFDLDTVQADDVLMLKDRMNEAQEFNREVTGSMAKFTSKPKPKNNDQPGGASATPNQGMSLADRIANGDLSRPNPYKGENPVKAENFGEEKPGLGKALKLSIQELISQDQRSSSRRSQNFQRPLIDPKDEFDTTKGFSAQAA